MLIDAKRILSWKNTKTPHPVLACALCGRRLEESEPCKSALWEAQGGRYIQAYHPDCADVVKLWGYPAKLLSPSEAESWAQSFRCRDCKDRIRCGRYVFDCAQAMETIKLLGGCAKIVKETANDE